MSVNPATGRHECDRCGFDIKNGGVSVALVVNDQDPDDRGRVRTYGFCRDHPDPDNPEETILGCHREVLGPEDLAHYNARQEAARA